MILVLDIGYCTLAHQNFVEAYSCHIMGSCYDFIGMIGFDRNRCSSEVAMEEAVSMVEQHWQNGSSSAGRVVEEAVGSLRLSQARLNSDSLLHGLVMVTCNLQSPYAHHMKSIEVHPTLPWQIEVGIVHRGYLHILEYPGGSIGLNLVCPDDSHRSVIRHHLSQWRAQPHSHKHASQVSPADGNFWCFCPQQCRLLSISYLFQLYHPFCCLVRGLFDPEGLTSPPRPFSFGFSGLSCETIFGQ